MPKAQMQDARALLDSLMGHNRNADMDDEEQQRQKGRWKGSEVCKHFLVGFCPYGLFEGTRAELGPCGRLHEEVLRSAYKAEASEHTKAKYERRFLGFLRDLISSLDRKIQREQGRLDQEDQNATGGQPPDPTNPDLRPPQPQMVFSDAQRERLEKIEAEVEDKKNLMEKYGNEGRVDKAQELLEQVQRLETEKASLHAKAKVQANWATPQDRCLKMCEVCGAYLDRRDSQQRKDNHLKAGYSDNHPSGRVHQGYSLIRETAQELETREKARKEKEEQEKDKVAISKLEKELRSDDEKETSDKDKEKEKERDDRSSSRRRSRSRGRRRSRSRSRGRRRRRRSRSRSRRRRRSRSRSRGRRRRR